jgi:hypothetical protein
MLCYAAMRSGLAACSRARRCFGAIARGLLLSAAATSLHVPGLARAEPRAKNDSVRIEGSVDACIHARALRPRVAHYLGKTAAPSDVLVRVQDTPRGLEFTLVQGTALRARRRFTRLPSACADQRDAVALAIALALESLTARTPEGATDSEPFVAQAPASDPQLPADEAASIHSPSQLGAAPDDDPTGIEQTAPQARSAPPSPTEASPELGSESGRAAQPGPDAARPPAVEARSAAVAPSALSERSTARDRDAGNEGLSMRRRLTRTALVAGTRAIWEVVPTTLVAFSLGVELPLLPHFALELAGFGTLAAQLELLTGQVRAQLFGAEMLGCGHGARRRVGIYGCLGVTGGQLRAHGEGYAEDHATQVRWVAMLLRATLRIALTRLLALQLTAGAHLSQIRPQLRLVGTEEVAQSGWLGGSLGLDVVVRFR